MRTAARLSPRDDELYARWVQLALSHPTEAFSDAAIARSWEVNHEHPALMKSLFAISRNLLWEKWKVFEDFSTACRFPAMLMGGLAIAVTYLFAARAYSRRAGVFAAAFTFEFLVRDLARMGLQRGRAGFFDADFRLAGEILPVVCERGRRERDDECGDADRAAELRECRIHIFLQSPPRRRANLSRVKSHGMRELGAN